MSAAETADRVAAETWFLQRGLPSVLTPRARWRRLWQRSAPALAGFATVSLATLIIAIATGFRTVEIDLEPTTAEWVVLAVLPSIVWPSWWAGWYRGSTMSDFEGSSRRSRSS